MNENDRKQPPRKDVKSVRLPVDLFELAREIEKARTLMAESARLISELQQTTVRVEGHLRRMRRAPVLQFPASD